MAKRKKTTKTGIIACSQKSKGQKDVPFLPEEIIVNILGRLPAKFLHDHARYVCKTWAHILRLPSFIKPHFLPSNSVLLVRDRFGPCVGWFLEVNKGKLEMTDTKLQFPGPILGSSEGVLLILKGGFQTLYVANPVTMQVMKLPYIPAFVISVGSNIACIPHTGELMVVCTGIDYVKRTRHCYILTVGSNMSWRKFDTIVPGCDLNLCFENKSVSAGGVLYWRKTSWNFDRSILALDLRDETVHNFRVPKEFCDVHCYLSKMENYLSCISWGPTGTMKVCLLKDLHQNEWVITYVFDLNENNPIRKYYSSPIAWLDNHQIMIFLVTKRTSEVFLEFNGKTGKWKNFKNIKPSCYGIEVHTNSLVLL